MIFENAGKLFEGLTLVDVWPSMPLIYATSPTAETGSFVLTGVLLSLVVVYFISKVGGELSKRLDLPPVLGELVGGVVVGASALHFLVFPETGAMAGDSTLMALLQSLGQLDPEALTQIFESQSEVIAVLAELGVIVLLFEIGLESDLRELGKVGYQAAIVAVVGVTAPFVLGTAALVLFFDIPIIPAVFAGAAPWWCRKLRQGLEGENSHFRELDTGVERSTLLERSTGRRWIPTGKLAQGRQR